MGAWERGTALWEYETLDIIRLLHGGYIVMGIFIGNSTHVIMFYHITYFNAMLLATNPPGPLPHGHLLKLQYAMYMRAQKDILMNM